MVNNAANQAPYAWSQEIVPDMRDVANLANEKLDITGINIDIPPGTLTPEQREENVAAAIYASEIAIRFGAFFTDAPQTIRYNLANDVAPETAVEQRERNEELVKLALEDGLTGLFNQSAFKQAQSQVEANPTSDKAFVIWDANYFKPLNDTLGHAAGDELLILIADTLKQAGEEHDDTKLYRMGGDEFAAITSKDTAEALMVLAEQKLQERISSDEPIVYGGGKRIDMTVVRGLKFGLTGGTGETAETADAAMYARKQQRNITRESN